MNWTYLRPCAWVDTRTRFVAGTPPGGTLLDLGSSDGQTLGHMAELRPDLHFFATDMAGTPEHDRLHLPPCRFERLGRGIAQRRHLQHPRGGFAL